MSDNGERGMNLLIFEGGGAGGLSGLFILREIMNRIVAAGGDRRIRKMFTVVAGSGSGGLHACMLGRLRIELEDATSIFVRLLKSVLADRKMISMGDTASFKAKRLEAELKKMVKDATGDENTRIVDNLPDADECKTMIFAMSKHNMTASTPRIFRSYQGFVNQLPNCAIWEALRATMAHPDLFKSIQIGGPLMPEEFIGGDVGCSNAISHVLTEVGALHPNEHIASIICIAAGHASTIQIPKPSPFHRLVPMNVLVAMKNIATDSEREAQGMDVRFQNTKDFYFRFSVDQGMQSPRISEWQRQSEVVAHTRAYMLKPEITRKIDRAIQSIKDRKAIVETSCMMVKIQQSPLQQLSGTKLCPSPSPLFTGCDHQVILVTTCLLGSPGERRICVIYGLGGGGKTEIALRAVEKTKACWSDIVYVDATSLETATKGLKAFAASKHIGETREDVMQWLEYHPQPWLLIVDNADDPDLGLRSFIPQGSHGSVLVTTRLRSLALLGQGPNSALSVGGMSPGDALELLLKKARVQDQVLADHEVEAATGLTKDLGYLALAIVHAGAYIWCSDISFVKYRRECLDHPKTILEKYSNMPVNIEQYQKTVYTTWLMSYEKIGPRAKQMLCLLSFLHHDWIVEDIFRHAATNKTYRPEVPPSDDEVSAQNEIQTYLDSFLSKDGHWDPRVFSSIMDELMSYSLINYDRVNDTYNLHVLVQSWASSVRPSNTGVGLEQTSYLIALSIHGSPYAASGASRRGLSLHVGRLLTGGSQISANNAARFAQAYCDNGEWKKEERLLVKVVESRKRVLGENHPSTLTSMNDLASTYLNQGLWDKAEGLQVLVLERRRLMLGKHHPDTLMSMNNLGSTYLNQGRWGEAERSQVQVLEASKWVLGEDHPFALNSMSNLASTYSKQGRWYEAERLQVQVLEIIKRVFGDNHPDTLTGLNNLAITYSNQNRWDEAERLQVLVLETSKRVLGEDHPFTLNSRSNLASTYLKQGRWDEAESSQMQVLEIIKRVFGDVHPDTLTGMSNLASTYWSQGRWDEAERLEVQVLETRKRVIGDSHPSTLISMSNLALTYRDQGRWDEAERLQVLVLEIRKRVFGDDHQDTLTAMETLSMTYSNQARWDGAKRLQVQALEIRKRVFGEGHPSTLTSMSNLASIYSKHGQWDNAERLQVQVLETSKRALFNDHPDMLTNMGNLASTYSNQGRWDEAERLQVQMLEQMKRVLGVDHPDTLTGMNNLASIYWSQGRWDEAEGLELQVLETRRRVLGETHLSTLTSMNNLAITYWNKGRWNEAERLQVKVLGTRKRVLGNNHPSTLISMSNLALTYRHQGRWDEAEALQVKTIKVGKRVFGCKHPRTVGLMHHLLCIYEHLGFERHKDREALQKDIQSLEAVMK